MIFIDKIVVSYNYDKLRAVGDENTFIYQRSIHLFKLVCYQYIISIFVFLIIAIMCLNFCLICSELVATLMNLNIYFLNIVLKDTH